MKIIVHNLDGKKNGEIELSESIFNVPANDTLLHQVYVSQAANRRRVLAHAKDRSETAGSGKKPWAQKGTGRARTGAARNPIWRGGGAIFGPTKDRNFKKLIPIKMKRKALLVALSGKAKSDDLVVVDKIALQEKKTKFFVQSLAKLKIKASALVGLAETEKNMFLCVRNIPKVDPIAVNQINVFDLLNHKYLIISKEAVEYLENKYKNA